MASDFAKQLKAFVLNKFLEAEGYVGRYRVALSPMYALIYPAVFYARSGVSYFRRDPSTYYESVSIHLLQCGDYHIKIKERECSDNYVEFAIQGREVRITFLYNKPICFY